MIDKKLDIWLRRLSATALVVVLVVTGVILFGGERWWCSAALTYLPRVPWALPSLLLLPVVLFRKQWWAAVACLAGVLIVAGPLMNVRFGLDAAAAGSQTVRVATCNIQGGNPDFGLVLRELKAAEPDVIAFQECDEDRPELTGAFPDHSAVREASFLVASRWPVESVGLVESDSMRRWCGGVFRVDHPQRPFLVVNVHCATARHGLAPLRDRTQPIGDAIEKVNVHQALREGEVFDLLDRVREETDLPVVLAGDFNQPANGTFLRRAFGDWTSAFDAAGTGYGYTAPCDTARLWPPNLPWLRIDHVLVRPSEFGVVSAAVGETAGSDHRLITADLTWD